jgi:hypothetical protein
MPASAPDGALSVRTCWPSVAAMDECLAVDHGHKHFTGRIESNPTNFGGPGMDFCSKPSLLRESAANRRCVSTRARDCRGEGE